MTIAESAGVVGLHRELGATGMHSACLVIWPDNRTRKARPVRRNQDWLDVEAGGEIFVASKRKTILEICVYRSTRGFEGEPVVRSGREWMLRTDAAAGPVDQRSPVPTAAVRSTAG